MKVLAEEAAVRIDGKWRTLLAILVTTLGGRKVIYLDRDGIEVYAETASKSQFKEIIKKIKNEEEDN